MGIPAPRLFRPGSTLIIAVGLALILAATAVALTTEVMFRRRLTKEGKYLDETELTCRAGLERARRALYEYRTTDAWDPALGMNGKAQWNSILAYCRNASPPPDRVFEVEAVNFPARAAENYDRMKKEAEFGTYLANPEADGAATFPEAPAKTEAEVIFGQNKPFRRGGYLVVLRDNDDGDGNPLEDTDDTIVAFVTATLDDGTQREIEAVLCFEPPTYVQRHAVLGGGNVHILGAVKVNGLEPTIKANERLTFVGVANHVEGTSYAGGTITGSPDATSGALMPDTPPDAIPEIDPFEFWSHGTYFLKEDGTITDADLNVLFNANLKGRDPLTGLTANWNGFTYTSSTGWTYAGTGSPPAGVYAVQADLTIAGTGTFEASFLVLGTMKISGDIKLTPYPSMLDVAALARGDLTIAGTPGLNDLRGFYAAHEQILIAGTPNLRGALLAENAQDVRLGVSGKVSAITIVGTPNITHDGGLRTGLLTPSGVAIRQIRRIK
ncbi:MAG: hypothetical protein HY716_16975 [Planctomycetes bacterium]|nr:hypothetical protein [Planctomycetota bacterium]